MRTAVSEAMAPLCAPPPSLLRDRCQMSCALKALKKDTNAFVSEHEATVSIDYAILIVCRSAVVKSPAGSRAALTKHRASIDRKLTNLLEDVGSYTNEVTISNITRFFTCSIHFKMLLLFVTFAETDARLYSERK